MNEAKNEVKEDEVPERQCKKEGERKEVKEK